MGPGLFNPLQSFTVMGLVIGLIAWWILREIRRNPLPRGEVPGVWRAYHVVCPDVPTCSSWTGCGSRAHDERLPLQPLRQDGPARLGQALDQVLLRGNRQDDPTLEGDSMSHDETVRADHHPIDALHTPTNRVVQVCAGRTCETAALYAGGAR